MPHPELEEPEASEHPEVTASEPETSGPEAAAAPATEPVPEARSAPDVESDPEPEGPAKPEADAKPETESRPDAPAEPEAEPAASASNPASAEASAAKTEKPAAPAQKPAAKKPRRFLRFLGLGRPRGTAAVTAAVLVVGGGTAAVVWRTGGFDSAPAPDLEQVAPAYHGLAGSLPWPDSGETALWAQGVGSLGTCGEQTPVPIASVAKVMTAYVILKDHPLADGRPGPTIDVDRQAETESFSRDESSAPVRAGQRLSERSLLELMLVPSANNVARLLARWDAGDQDSFVAKMNAAAAELGMRNTTYTDPSGFASTTTSTASDQLLLAESALTDPTLLALTAEPATQVPGDATVLSNTDSLLGSNGVVGGKTGSSTPAGGALMWAAHRDLKGEDHLVLGVVLHQDSGTTPERGLSAVLVSGRLLMQAMR